jgi:hypothetical protein
MLLIGGLGSIACGVTSWMPKYGNLKQIFTIFYMVISYHVHPPTSTSQYQGLGFGFRVKGLDLGFIT